MDQSGEPHYPTLEGRQKPTDRGQKHTERQTDRQAARRQAHTHRQTYTQTDTQINELKETAVCTCQIKPSQLLHEATELTRRQTIIIDH